MLENEHTINPSNSCQPDLLEYISENDFQQGQQPYSGLSYPKHFFMEIKTHINRCSYETAGKCFSAFLLKTYSTQYTVLCVF